MIPVILHGLGAVILGMVTMIPDDAPRGHGAETEWHLVELRGTRFDAKATLTFPAPDRIAGAAPCNRYNGGNAATYPSFNAGPIAATRMACPNLAAETAFFAALEAATQSEVAGDTLILSDDTATLLVFKAAD